MFNLMEKKIMRSHDKIKSILQKSEKIKNYDAIGIITIIMLVGFIVDGISILKFCTSKKGVALIIKNGGPLVRMFIRRNLYNKIIKANVPEEHAKIISDTIVELMQSLSIDEIVSLLDMVYNENS